MIFPPKKHLTFSRFRVIVNYRKEVMPVVDKLIKALTAIWLSLQIIGKVKKLLTRKRRKSRRGLDILYYHRFKMANIITVIIILTIVLKVIDFTSLSWLDYSIFMLILIDLGLSVVQWVQERRRGNK